MNRLMGIISIIICIAGFIGSQYIYAAKATLVSYTRTGLPIGHEIDEPDPGLSKISKTFAVNASDKVILNNKYGTLTVRTWNKNEVKLDVIVYGSPELDARKLSEMVTVNAVKKEGVVILDTRLSESKRLNGKKIRVEFLVYMPETNSLTLSHQYGNVNIGDFTGSVVAGVQYGNFVAGDLKNNNNDLSISYGSTTIKSINKGKISQEYGNGLTIGTVGTLSLNASYAAVRINTIIEKASISQEYGAGLIIGTVGQLNLDAAYANVQIGTIKNHAKISNQYSNLKISVANALNLNAQYSNVKIGRLNGDGKLNIQYNSLNLDEVSTDCQSLIVDCAYVKTFIKFNSNYNGSLDASTSNSSLNCGPGILMKVEGDKQNRRYTGKIGAGGNAKVNLVSSYGSAVVN
jgi:dimeric dUTPase (all-alpha-NTP-PPase superfamily)